MHPIRDRNFQILLAARFLSGLSKGFFAVPLFWWIIQTTGSGSLVAAAALISSLTFLAVAPWGGVLADRYSKKRLVIGMDVTDLVFNGAAGALLLLSDFRLAFALPLLVITGLTTALRGPSLGALLPLLISEESYQQGNATMGLASTLARLSSYAVAGIATAVLGVGGALLTGSGLLFVATLVIIPLKEPVITHVTTQHDTGQGVKGKRFTGVFDGFLLLKSNSLLLALILTAALLNFILSPLAVILTPFAKLLGAGASGYGDLNAAALAGELLGLGLMNLFRVQRAVRVLLGGTLGIALSMLGLAFSFSLLPALASLLFAATCASVMSTQLSVVFQKSVPKALLGRASGLMSALSMGAQPAGYAAAGGLLAVTSIRNIFLAITVLLATSSLMWLRPNVQRGFRDEVEEPQQGKRI